MTDKLQITDEMLAQVAAGASNEQSYTGETFERIYVWYAETYGSERVFKALKNHPEIMTQALGENCTQFIENGEFEDQLKAAIMEIRNAEIAAELASQAQ